MKIRKEIVKMYRRTAFYGFLVLISPLAVFAQTGGGSVGPTTLRNPLSFNTIEEFFLAILDIIIIFAVPIIIFFIIYAGFMFVTANGNAEKIKSARSAITWAVVGGLLILGARILLAVIQQTVNALK